MSGGSPPPIRVAVSGAAGRMGREVVRAVRGADDMEVVAAIDRAAGPPLDGIAIEGNLAVALQSHRPKVLVDFTVAEAALGNIETALAAGVVPVVGTTGLKPDDLETVRALCARHAIPALIAPNFAIGAVLLMRFAAEAARFLPDVEIIEMHHERKVDAPSGTAAKTAEMIAAARQASPVNEPPGAFETFAGARGGRAAGEIRVHSVRLPGFVASQEVIFGAPGQRLSLRHDSIDRTSFMPGVLLAIRHARTLSGLVYGLEHLL